MPCQFPLRLRHRFPLTVRSTHSVRFICDPLSIWRNRKHYCPTFVASISKESLCFEFWWCRRRGLFFLRWNILPDVKDEDLFAVSNSDSQPSTQKLFSMVEELQRELEELKKVCPWSNDVFSYIPRRRKDRGMNLMAFKLKLFLMAIRCRLTETYSLSLTVLIRLSHDLLRRKVALEIPPSQYSAISIAVWMMVRLYDII